MSVARFQVMRTLLLAMLSLSVSAGCSSLGPKGPQAAFSSEQNPSGITQVEVQQDVQRFASEFNDRIVQAFEPLLNSKNKAVSDEALRRVLLYTSSSTEIAVGPNAEANLLDMLWFVRLNRLVVQDYWVPKIYGKEGTRLLTAFRKAEGTLWRIAGKVLNESGRQQLIAMVDEWRRANPEQTRVEFVRLSAFSELAGRQASREAENAKGLLSNVKSAMAKADAALLLGERLMYLAQREPFLLRLHAQLGTRDIVGDLLERGSAAEGLVNGPAGVRPLMGDATTLSESALRTIHESRLLAEVIARDIMPPKEDRIPGNFYRTVLGIRDSLASAERLLDRVGGLAREANTQGPASITEPVADVVGDVERMIRRAMLYLVLIGASWAVFGWGGYFLAKRGLESRA